ncbi:MAG: hypothetical protein FWD61_20030 [Phycisphaerales bacterium]|nr:hypothetical protein [Phycisphaerales bacterium]
MRNRLVPLVLIGVMALGVLAADPAPLPPVERFDYVISTQTIGASYQFTSEPRLVETAKAIREMGATAIKFSLFKRDMKPEEHPERYKTLTELAAKEPSFRQVFDMPFGHFLIWAYSLSEDRNRPPSDARDGEIYDLACHLLKTYDRSGKTFYIGHWEGDWELRGKEHSKFPTPEAIEAKIRWLNRRQKAIDDARRDTPHRDVDVFCYVEANRVFDAIKGKPSIANDLLPACNPDFVSYSAWDAMESNIPTDKLGEHLTEALNYLDSKLPAKPAITGKRVFVGEYGFPRRKYAPEVQVARSREVMKAAIRWGCRFCLYWELYNNEVDDQGQRGFWLIDDKNVKQPVYFLHREFLAKGREYVADFHVKNKRFPSDVEFRAAAISWLNAIPATQK